MNSGLVLGLVVFAISVIITTWTLDLLAETANKEQIFDYSELVEKYFGYKMLVLTELMSLLNNMGGVVAINKFSKVFSKYS